MELKLYLKPLLKWWWLILLATALASVSSYLALGQQPPTYESRTTLMIGRTIDDPNPTGTQFNLGQQLAQTYADIARREPIRNATKEALGMNWLPTYTVNALPNTQLIEIIVVDTSPERSYVVAKELANQLIRLSPSGPQQEEQERQAFINQQLNNLQVQIEETTAEIEFQQEILGGLFSAQQLAETQTQIAALEEKRSTLQANYAALVANTNQGAINALTIIENAAIPSSPVNSNKLLTLLSAAAIGFVLAASVAYLLEYLDDSIKTLDDVRQTCDLPALVGIAPIKLENEGHKLVAYEQPRSPISEAFRILSTRIQFYNIDHACRRILITSARPKEGKSVIAANLAIVMAQAGHRVLLIDADLRKPTQHLLFELNPKPGLTALLLNSRITKDGTYEILLPPEKYLQKTAIRNLYLLASDIIPPNPSELLSSVKLKTTLDALSARFDFLIIDSTPILDLADSIALSIQTDVVILVAHAKKTKRKELKTAVSHLREVNANVIGVTLNGLSTKLEGRYDEYYKSAENQDTSHQKQGMFVLSVKQTDGLDRPFNGDP
jgi:non-specific protein-tyrosine kinase